MKSSRALALKALMAFAKNGTHLSDTFDLLSGGELPLAKELAFGTLRYQLKLSALLKTLNDERPVKVKGAIHWLGRMAIYQALYMDKAPMYAIVHETIEMAKRVSPSQAKFLNALLRKIEPGMKEIHFKDRSIEYSLPSFLFPMMPSEPSVLEALLERPQVMLRSNLPIEGSSLELIERVGQFWVYNLMGGGSLDDYLGDPGVYIQNITPVRLMDKLYDSTFKPTRILDLCAAPGGKLTLAHALFPEAELFANDLIEERLPKLEENLKRMGVEATLTCADGTQYSDQLSYDLIILDLPCSNTGVLSKKPEAKYRLNQEELNRIIQLQQSLVKRALHLLSEGGEVWVMTCSILPIENEGIVEYAQGLGAEKLGEAILCQPDQSGADGGFGVKFKRVES